MGVCMFATCTSNQKDKSISFFRVPVNKDPKLAKQWFLRAKRADLKFSDVTSSHVVCQKHFLPEQLYTEEHGGVGNTPKTRPRVKPGEIPQPISAGDATHVRIDDI